MGEYKQKYQAIIWKPESNEPGEHVTVLAGDLEKAKIILETKYGKDSVFDLHNAEDADKPR